ncbi:MAG: general secretion pathway protein GspK [Synergistaceae bacterium]|nr:general secretion pathway protein GspK [Synergistaceae bacterium]
MKRELSRSREGFILLSVLMLGVVLISTATAFAWFARSQARTVSGQTQELTNRTFAHVLVHSVANVISDIFSDLQSDSLTQKWYQPFVIGSTEFDGVWVVKITPLDDKIPVSQLFLPDGSTMRTELTEVWHQLFEKLGRLELEQILLDFMDSNNKPRVGGAERDDFLNRPLYDISELLMLSGDIDSEVINGYSGKLGIADYCTVYSDGKININVAPVHVIELLPGLDSGTTAQSIVSYREDRSIESLSELQEIPGISAGTLNRSMNVIGFKSRYFDVRLEFLPNASESGSSFSVILDKTDKKIVKWEEL